MARRNLLLFFLILVGGILLVNSTKRILTFRTTSQLVKGSEARLEELRGENESLKRELEYKKSQEFAESEIRNKLGLVKEGETVVVLPKEGKEQAAIRDKRLDIPNWQKWWELFFGEG